MKMKLIIIAHFFMLFELKAQQPLKIKSSNISFVIKNAGLKVNGTFSDLVASIYLDENNISEAKISASVASKTIQTGVNARDKHLKKEDYFDVENFPLISLNLVNKITKKEGIYYANFELSIKKTKKVFIIPFTFSNHVLKSSFEINRRNFDVGGSSWILSDFVLINIDILTE
ncbi:MAG: YceI family protein [Cytophagales bacterium]|nr:MAG: YceI family protein [Cytophagales bacterium]